jgi:hypothetical protein
MRLCGKRLFTPACKLVRSMLEGCGPAFAGPHFFWRVVRGRFFTGFWRIQGVLVWRFCGEVVVIAW